MAKSRFDLKSEIEKLANSLTADIFSPKKRAEIKREYIEHIEDAVYRYKISGMDDKEAFKKASEDMGDVSSTRFLLSEVHNNKVQLFVVEKVVKKLRTFFTSKLFLIICITIVVLVLLTVFTWPLALLLFGDIYGYCQALLTNTSLWLTFGVVVALVVALFVFIRFILPMFVYALKKIFIYISLFNICIFSKYQFKLKRNPLASLTKMSDSGDILIIANKKTFCLHFIDIVFPSHRALTIPNDKYYIVTHSLPSRISRYGGSIGANMSGARTIAFGATEHSLEMNSDMQKSFPKVVLEDKVRHVLLIPNMPVEAKYVKNGSRISLSSGEKIGNIIYCSVSYLKKELKNKLHTSIFD